MSTKKKSLDPKVIASKQAYELHYIVSTWYDINGKRLPIATLKDIVKKIGHSRRAVYSVLRYLNFHFQPRKKN